VSPIDWFYQYENMKVVCSDCLWRIIEIKEEVEDEGKYINFLNNSTVDIQWSVCNGFIRVELIEEGDWINSETLTVPFEWLDMSEEELASEIKKEREDRENRQMEKEMFDLTERAKNLGYKLFKDE